MVLGLIDFLLGGKKKTKVPRSGQVTTPLASVGGNSNEPQVPGSTNQNGAVNQTQNVAPPGSTNEMKFGESDNSSSNDKVSEQNNGGFASSNAQPQVQQSSMGGRKSISEVISKIHEEIKNSNENIAGVVTDIKTLQNSVNTLGHRIDDLEESKKGIDDKLTEADRNMTKFLSLYELINNQYNPFVEQNVEVTPKKIELGANGDSVSENNGSSSNLNFSELSSSVNSNLTGGEDLDATFLNLDTLNIEEAAGDAVPLISLKNNTNSLVTILSWLEYLIKKEGVEATRDSLRYYTETLRWITPEVFFDLDKYLRGMKDRKDLTENESLTVRDHIVSLYFISKLNEKVLDEKLTKAVLQIIKE